MCFIQQSGVNEIHGATTIVRSNIKNLASKVHIISQLHIYLDNMYPKQLNKWWNGYDGQDYVLIEEFDRDFKCSGYLLKIWTIWTDRYPLLAEIKGFVPNISLLLVIFIQRKYSLPKFTSDNTVIKAQVMTPKYT